MAMISERQRTFASYAIDVLIYLVVLNLFVEFADFVVIDSFALSILTAVVLKILLDLVKGAEHRVSHYFKRFDAAWAKAARVFGVWFILFSSKFVILEVIDIVFGEHVELGSFIEIIFLILAMMIAREVFMRIYRALGDDPDAGVLPA